MMIPLLQVIVFLALLFNTVQLIPASIRQLRTANSVIQAGFFGALISVRLSRNVLGLILVTASTAPNPQVHDLVPAGIALLLALASTNIVLTHFGQRSVADGIRF